MLSLIVHGGAWNIPDELVERHRAGIRNALNAGWEVLRKGGSSVDAVECAIMILEDDDTFDAGRGSHLNAAGEVELDASIMNGKSMRCGAVASVRKIRNPISLCRKIMEDSEHILLVGHGAEEFAVSRGMNLCDQAALKVDREIKKWQAIQGKGEFSTKDAFRASAASDTVGAVAMDKNGEISVGTSTGGTFNKHPGRVGDSPLIGCGSYAENAFGGVSTTGWGEAMIKIVMAKTVVDLMEQFNGDVAKATQRGIELLKQKVDGYGGIIALNANGQPGVAFNTTRMARAYVNEKSPEPFIAV
ncbi:MAG TPA: isoaspartyl peptidase/L-asparaginase [Bacteroidota bacterium]|nr:isoaspartyl peptidase/L-asparaginase [Bacteroidota bacterium]